MVASLGFPGLRERVRELSDEQRYADAYRLVTDEGPQFTENESEVYYLRSCAAARMGDADLAVALLREALERGHWYGEVLLRQSPSWEPLQGTADFEVAARESTARRRAASVPLATSPWGARPVCSRIALSSLCTATAGTPTNR